MLNIAKEPIFEYVILGIFTLTFYRIPQLKNV